MWITLDPVYENLLPLRNKIKDGGTSASFQYVWPVVSFL